MQKYKLFINYLGSSYCGWQRTCLPKSVSVQEDLEQHFRGVFPEAQVFITASGRTDAGVHAVTQVCHVSLVQQRKPIPLDSGLPIPQDVPPGIMPTAETILKSWDRFCQEQYKVWRLQRKNDEYARRMEKQKGAVRLLPAAIPSMFIASSAAIDVVRPSAQHKYEHSFARLCIMGLRGLHSVHCDVGICKTLYPRAPDDPAPATPENSCTCGLPSEDIQNRVVDLSSRLRLDLDTAGLAITSKTSKTQQTAPTSTSATEGAIDASTSTSTSTSASATSKPLSSPAVLWQRHAVLQKQYLNAQPTIMTADGPQIALLRDTMSDDQLALAVNERLREATTHGTIRVAAVERVPKVFNARHDAAKRRYVYRVLISPQADVFEEDRAWCIRNTPAEFDIDKARAIANALQGRHDFNAFRSAGCQARSPIRTLDEVSLEWRPSYREELQGYPFAYHDDPEAQHALVHEREEALGLGMHQSMVEGANVMVHGYVHSNLMSTPGPAEPLAGTGPAVATELPAEGVPELELNAKQTAEINLFLAQKGLGLDKDNRVVSLCGKPHAPPDPETRETVRAAALRRGVRPGSVLTITVVSRAFLHSQVRIIVGAIVDAGFGSFDHGHIHDIINNRDRHKNPAQTAPPEGLHLTNVVYPQEHERRAWKDLQYAQVRVERLGDRYQHAVRVVEDEEVLGSEDVEGGEDQVMQIMMGK